MGILEIRNLSVEYYRNRKVIPAVRDVSLELKRGETLALVGESGSGKSTLALSVLGLIFPYEGKITSGEIIFEGKNLLGFSAKEWQNLRGKQISMVFQDPFSSLNPVLTAGEQIAEALWTHQHRLSKNEQFTLIKETLNETMFTDVNRIYNSYPHQLSGGQRQRIAMAMALINRPKILIADEPTTALDVTIQKEILDLLEELKKELSLSVLLITHNLALASQRSQRIAVMYAGEIVETGKSNEIFKNPTHLYTKGLIESVPKLRK